MQRYSHIIGIDEAGRGPLAGPVAVGAVAVPTNFDWRILPGVTDSKQLSHENREAIFMRTRILQKEGKLLYAVSLVGPATIDRVGITKAVRTGITRCLCRLPVSPTEADVRLDGLLKAPVAYTRQITITKGDAKEKVIGLASIMAKVTRDRHMAAVAKKYPKYGFETHKGYGTKQHIQSIQSFSPCEIHRLSFLGNL